MRKRYPEGLNETFNVKENSVYWVSRHLVYSHLHSLCPQLTCKFSLLLLKRPCRDLDQGGAGLAGRTTTLEYLQTMLRLGWPVRPLPFLPFSVACHSHAQKKGLPSTLRRCWLGEGKGKETRTSRNSAGARHLAARGYRCVSG